MRRSRGLKTFLAALCLSAVAMDSAWAQAGADPAPAPQNETVVSPDAQGGSQAGWLLQGRGRGRGLGQAPIANPFRSTPAPGTGRAVQDTAQPGLLPQAGVGAQVPTKAIPGVPGERPGCTIGFRRQGGTCVAVDIPENGTIDLTGHGWMCNRGFRHQDQGCVAVELPENASLDATGHRWACNYGFRRQAQTCIAVAVPEHASLDKAGHTWTCNEGYERRNQGCIDDATARLQQQADRAVNARPGTAKAGSRPSVTVNSGENRQGRTSRAKVVIGRF